MRTQKLFLTTILIIFFVFSEISTHAQVAIDNSLTPTELVQQVLLGNGVSVSNITFNGQSGDVLNEQIARYTGPSAVIEFPEAIVMKSGHTANIADPFFPVPFPFPVLEISNDPDLQDISNIQSINNCAILEFDFVPNGDSLVFRYVFASIEYPGFTCSGFNDAFGFFLSGPGISGPFTNNAINIALIPNSNTPVAVNTINSGVSSQPGGEPNCFNANPNWVADAIYFVDNGLQPPGDVMFPGMTVTLTAYAQVICGQEYHIKLAIADASDSSLDSGVFLEAGSFASNSAVQVILDIPVGVSDSTLYEGCGVASLQFVRPAASLGIEESAFLDISGSAINGIDFTPMLPDSIVFGVGVDTVSFVLNAPNEGNFEGQEFVQIFITNIASGCAGTEVTSEFSFFINEADPLQISGFDGALEDCNDDLDLFPTITGGFGQYNYSWSNGSTADTVNVSPGFTTNYFLVVSDTCGAGSQQTSFEVEVPVYPIMMVDLGEDITVNECDVTVQIIPEVSGGFGGYTYQWTENGAVISTSPILSYLVENSITLTLSVYDDCEALGTDQIDIILPAVEVTAFLPDIFSSSNCLQEFLMPVISEGGIGTKTYTWIVDGVEQMSSQVLYFMYHPSMGQNVVMRAEDECQNIAIDSTVVDFNFPEIILRTSPDTSICENTSAELRVEATSGSGFYKYYWETLDSTSQVVNILPENSRMYPVVVKDTCGTEARANVRVDVRQVFANFEYDYQGYYGVNLRNLSRPYEATYQWDFGDGETSTDLNPIHSFRGAEPYDMMLVTMDDIGCTDTIIRSTKPPIEIFIPSAFTPNGDGINDLFVIEGAEIIEFQMWIYDRWGKLVFETNDIHVKWNGSHLGGDYYATTSLYNYYIKYKGEKEEEAYEITGTISVIR